MPKASSAQPLSTRANFPMDVSPDNDVSPDDLEASQRNSANGAIYTSEGRSPSYKRHKYQRAEGPTYNYIRLQGLIF